MIFVYYTFGISRQENGEGDGNDIRTFSRSRSVGLILLGLIGLILGGKWIVDSATTIAASWGVSQSFIGLTIVALGTSLPELATSVIAARKKNSDIAVGNVIGSNIFNIFLILGVSSIIRPLPVAEYLYFDVVVVFIATLMLFIFMFVGKRHTLERSQGLAFLILYALYIVCLVERG